MSQSGSPRIHVSVSLWLDIPGDAIPDDLLPDDDREASGKRLDSWIAEELPHLLNYVISDPDVEADW